MSPDIKDLDVSLDRGRFLGDVVCELVASLESIVGTEEATGFVSIVGQRIGEQIDGQYREALGMERLGRAALAQVLVDLKHRIDADFTVEESSAERIVLTNTQCPFKDRVVGHPALCMMTSTVFGTIAGESLGYAAVTLDKTIARGDGYCRVIVALKPSKSAPESREYFTAGLPLGK